MKAATLKTLPQTEPLHCTHLIVDGNSHRTDLCQTTLPATTGEHPMISEAMLPQIRTVAMLIAAMRHKFDAPSPDTFTEEADWFAARIIVLGVRRFHLDITLLPMLTTANRRAQAFLQSRGLPFTAAEMRMSLHAGRPANLLIIETASKIGSGNGMIADTLALARSLKTPV
ncbi:hypothetical protein [Neisseria sp. S1]|uniref:hypothetical protein n=1 Tax=Neisseria sp. S1 TaxID=3318354 RepID=UPI003A8A1BA0